MSDAFSAYGEPRSICDVVMKGGITSGVVYPLAISEIARTYQLHSIGGTSAGAIAAAAAAAAELGRHTEGAGFGELAKQPAWLGSGTNMFDLFQPDRATRRSYRVLTAGFGTASKAARVTKTLLAAIRGFPGWAAAGSSPGLLIIVTVASSASATWPVAAVISAALVAAMGALIGSLLGLVVNLARSLPANRFGLCSGRAKQPRSDHPALTDWLADLVDRLAGQPTTGRPLTFDDLWKGRDGKGTYWNRSIDLQMLTTNLSEGRPYRLPLEGLWFFDPKEFAHLFPERVLEHMVAAGKDMLKQVDEGEDDLAKREWPRAMRQMVASTGLLPFPRPEDLPVVVATRFSLSFPVLLSAIPLHTVDFLREGNKQARREWMQRLRAVRDAGRDVWANALSQPDHPSSSLELSMVWFSDGGISSNFPLPLFDGPIPRWPTFGINLTPFPPDQPPEEVWMPSDNAGGVVAELRRLETEPGIGAVVGFLRAIFDTMQNWSDNAQTRVPGFRDRVAHVRHHDYEGGLNLRMPPENIKALANRGALAGRMLVERFSADPPEGAILTWENHRWVRLRTFLGQLEDQIEQLCRNLKYEAEGAEDASLYGGFLVEGERPSYQLKQGQLALLQATVEKLNDLVGVWGSSGTSMQSGAPRPTPELKIRPRL